MLYECCVLAWVLLPSAFYVCSTSFTCNVAGFSRPMDPPETALSVKKVCESEGEWGKFFLQETLPFSGCLKKLLCKTLSLMSLKGLTSFQFHLLYSVF